MVAAVPVRGWWPAGELPKLRNTLWLFCYNTVLFSDLLVLFLCSTLLSHELKCHQPEGKFEIPEEVREGPNRVSGLQIYEWHKCLKSLYKTKDDPESEQPPTYDSVQQLCELWIPSRNWQFEVDSVLHVCAIPQDVTGEARN